MSADGLPARFDLRTGLTVTVHVRDITTGDGRLPCWAFVTEGLWAHGQKELALTVRRPPGAPPDGFPMAVLELYGAIFDLAAQGKLVGEGDYTEFGSTGFLGDPGIGGLIYVPYQEMPGIPMTAPALSAILVPVGELGVAKAFGVSRLMARLGEARSHFPCPDWSEPGRASVTDVEEYDQSVLGRMPTLRLSDASVTRCRDEVVLNLAPRGVGVLRTQLGSLPRKAPLALLTQVPPSADSLLVWRQGQQGPVAITAPDGGGSAIAGCFCAFLPKQRVDDAQLFEDGFVLMLTNRTWRRVRDALMAGTDVGLPPGPTGLSFAIRQA